MAPAGQCVPKGEAVCILEGKHATQYLACSREVEKAMRAVAKEVSIVLSNDE